MEKQKEVKCESCNGSGIIYTDLIFSDLWEMDCGTREDECEECGGKGVAQWLQVYSEY